jgi:hypothetical protein
MARPSRRVTVCLFKWDWKGKTSKEWDCDPIPTLLAAPGLKQRYIEPLKSLKGTCHPSTIVCLSYLNPYSVHSHLSDNRGLAERKILQLLRIFFWEETRQKNAIDVENKFGLDCGVCGMK